MNSIAQLFRSPQTVPDEYRSNFSHLYQDVFWFGILNGSAISFITIYATRLGASGQQIGLIGAAPAIIILLLALPVGRWLQGRSVVKAVFWSTIINRSFYLTWVLFPFVLNYPGQIWGIILSILIMSIPGTGVAVGFNAIFADSVPAEWRAHVAGIRNVIVSVTTTITSLVCGWILVSLPFPDAYQVVFGIGLIGGVVSALHIYYLQPIPSPVVNFPVRLGKPLGELTSPGTMRASPEAPRTGVGLRFFTRARRGELLQTDLLKGNYGKVVLLLFIFHLGQQLAIPIFPIFIVNHLQFTDQVISYGNAAFFVMTMVGSTQLSRLSSRLGHKKVTGIGVSMLASFPLFMTVSQQIPMFLFTNALGGFAWALAGGAFPNYLLDNVPADNRPPYLAWYTMGLNGAILIGSIIGPFVGSITGPVVALLIFAAWRFLAGIAVLKWG